MRHVCSCSLWVLVGKERAFLISGGSLIQFSFTSSTSQSSSVYLYLLTSARDFIWLLRQGRHTPVVVLQYHAALTEHVMIDVSFRAPQGHDFHMVMAVVQTPRRQRQLRRGFPELLNHRLPPGQLKGQLLVPKSRWRTMTL